ncbi:MAG: hypothetical protein DI616_20515 [Paracoccus denitrificans]|uniref:DUF7919 domain-containing protein n=1 Tax=Paracoccus denitrificans TaxID=266 RepID=A0A533HSE1_PARDE|nr:MAG: hypothetical protein DI616_20515 [Paracoccus denitrificans]
MTAYDDMTEYRYKKSEGEVTSKNIGWLGRDSRFRTGIAPIDFVQRLEVLSCIRFNATRGISDCPLCGERPIKNSSGQVLGSAEIKVPSDQERYSSPNLILHFVVRHNYLPPENYISAVLAMSNPKSDSTRADYEKFGVKVPEFFQDISYDW